MLEALAILITVGVYGLAKRCHQKRLWLHPLLTAPVLAGGIWWGVSGNWQVYQAGGEWITFWLGPATVALAVPLARHLRALLDIWRSLLAAVAAGCAVAMISGWLVMTWLDGDESLSRSMLSKSVTTPFSVELTRLVGGVPELAALFTVLTGLIGLLLVKPFLRLLGITDDRAIGIAVGTGAHAIGTAGLHEHPAQVAAASVAMILSGVVTMLYFLMFF